MGLLKKHDMGFYYYVKDADEYPGERSKYKSNKIKAVDSTFGRRVIFLDRDGVINIDSEEFIKECSEFVFCPGSIEAISMLARAGYWPAVISNQSGINRGIVTLENLNEMTSKMIHRISSSGGFIGTVCYCPHEPEENCPCRKPKTAMLQFASENLCVSGDKTYFIGDRQSDVEAAINFGVVPVLIDSAMKEGEVRPLAGKVPGYMCHSLITAVKKIVLLP